MLALHGANLKVRGRMRAPRLVLQQQHADAHTIAPSVPPSQAQDKNGKTPLDVAEGQDTKSMLERLKQGARARGGVQGARSKT